jgi:uncharacterized membrane protein YgcG
LPSNNGQPDNIAAALADISDRLTKLVQDEIELAKAEVTEKVSSIARGAAAVAAGAVFGLFALVFLLATIAWGLNSLLVSIWLGFAILFGILIVLTVGAFLFAWRKLKVGSPAPTLAIEEAKKIKDTVTAKPGAGR